MPDRLRLPVALLIALAPVLFVAGLSDFGVILITTPNIIFGCGCTLLLMFALARNYCDRS